MTIHHLFEQQAVRTPDATALLFGDLRVSYRELNHRATTLAHTLRRRGTGPNTLAGLLADRSVEMVAGILAILKAGAAYLPLSPNDPPERLAFMTRDAGLRLVLATPGREDLAGRLGAAVLPFPKGEGDSTPDGADGRSVQEAPGELAYVMYTSGSTGRPKGVLLAHAGLPPLVRFMRDQMRIGPGDRVLQFASFGFDVSVWEIFAALTSGATLVLATREDLLPGPSLHRLMCRQQVTIAVLSPSVLRILPPEGLDLLRIVVASMEKLSGDIVRRWRRPGRRFFNAYGPTEATIFQTLWEAPETGPVPDNPPIGQPAPGVAAWLLGQDGRPVQDGESGELCLAGVCLALGYVNRPELTREKFVPLSLGPGRVEPGEIESVLAQHPGVREVFVTALGQTAGDRRLVAYVVLQPPHDAGELRRFLQDRLPEYMVPAQIAALESLPKTPNGKLDREALPRPGPVHKGAGTARAAARTPLEEVLAGIWARVLRHDWVGVEDDFFLAGGHSLLALQLIHEINAAFGVDLPVRLLFAEPTVSGQAREIELTLASRNQGRSLSFSPLVPLRPGGDKPPFFLVARGASMNLSNRTRRWKKWPPSTFARSAPSSPAGRISSAARASAGWWPLKSRSSSAPGANRSGCWCWSIVSSRPGGECCGSRCATFGRTKWCLSSAAAVPAAVSFTPRCGTASGFFSPRPTNRQSAAEKFASDGRISAACSVTSPGTIPER
jgi:amino acid adenylation domain-containing protein